MATHAAQAPAQTLERLAASERVARGLQWLEGNADWVTEQQVKLTEVAAPPFEEAARAAHIKKVFASLGYKARVDELGNVIAERGGRSTRDVVLISAHMDTVFPAGTAIRVRRENGRLIAPGISDNGTGLAALMALARVMEETKLKTEMTLVFAANVGEEGEGNLRGMRKLVETYKARLRAVIVLDGSSIEHITTRALASRRLEIVITGPGGHSWSDFGLPNPIHGLSRGIARALRIRIPADPRTAFNFGVIEGGTSVNAIPARALVKVDLRSESEGELTRLENALREAIQAGVEEENSGAQTARPTGAGGRLEVRYESLGVRPGGELAANSPLLAAIKDVDRFLGLTSRLERSSTDANIPLALGIPAIAIGAGGRGGGAHSPEEWYEPAGRAVGLKRAFLTVISVAGVEP